MKKVILYTLLLFVFLASIKKAAPTYQRYNCACEFIVPVKQIATTTSKKARLLTWMAEPVFGAQTLNMVICKASVSNNTKKPGKKAISDGKENDYETIEAHGGNIRTERTKGDGIFFIIIIPIT